MNKTIHYIGLGKMGLAMTTRLHEKGWDVHAFDVDQSAREKAEAQGITVHASYKELLGAHTENRIIWIMVPHKFVQDVIDQIMPFLCEGDVVIDAGNSPYKLAQVRGKTLGEVGAQFMDVGVSGGPEGARDGACLMIGGKKDTYDRLEPLFADIAAPEAYQHLGPVSAGHFVKMVHNGIEYGMMQSIAEGFDLMHETDEFDLSMKDVTRIYQQQSVITSRLVGWLGQGFEHYGEELEEVSGKVGANGEGLWTVEAAHTRGMTLPAIESSIQQRNDSQENPDYRGKLLQTMRQMFGGHVGGNTINK